MMVLYQRAVLAVLILLLAGCDNAGKDLAKGSEKGAENAESTATAVINQETDWAFHGRTMGEQRYSPLDQINPETISQLNLAWYYDLPTNRGQEASPLIIDGVIYTTSAWSHVIALNAATGEPLWHFDPQVPKSYGVKGCCDAVNRGAAYMNGQIFVGTLDGRLIALNAETGEQNWSVLTVNQEKNYSITGAPRAVNGKVFIGNGGAEFGVRGYISAYDAESGALVWRFYTVPGGPDDPTGVEPVAAQTATWNGEWWALGGGGTVWDSMAYDPETNLLYFGVGNGSPWNPNTRTAGEGDNLYLSSMVAVDADSGEYHWHYQTTPGEAWDYTATQHMILAELDIAGETRKVIMQAPKNGFFYVLDRLTGELISAEPFVHVTWASHVDQETGRPVVNPDAEYWKTGVPAMVMPSWMGGHNWHPMSYSVQTGLVYLPAQEAGFPYLADDEQTPSRLAVNLGVDTSVAAFPDDQKVIDHIKELTAGHLLAWDPVQQKEVWRVQYPGVWNGGVLSTAGGLVFQGNPAGFLNAYRGADGEKLWEYPAQTGIVAPPVSYQAGGEQYLAVSAGWGGIFPLMTGPLVEDALSGADPINRSRLLVFKLGGNAKLPEPSGQRRLLPDHSSIEIDREQIEQGAVTYDRYCVGCHGAGAVGGGVIPDLRFSPMAASAEAWNQVVLGGILSERGMVSFNSELSEQDSAAVRAYVIGRNNYAHSIGETSRLSR